jgi:hypothetical protein
VALEARIGWTGGDVATPGSSPNSIISVVAMALLLVE